MGCHNSDLFTGKCLIYDVDIDEGLCADEHGNCLCEEDPSPSCSQFIDDEEGEEEW